MTLHSIRAVARSAPKRTLLFTAHITHRDLTAYDNSGRLIRHYTSFTSARAHIINWLLRDGRAGSRVEVFHSTSGQQRAVARITPHGRIILELFGDPA